ncbi:MAG: aminoacetone oxidase family FAD-binding enzyme [Clostridia bacterium]|nr:aminoacetone oxidase family FAD-binding enzyme [Clostridia bacterium]
MMNYDVCIIGAGASGLCAAVKLKTENPQLSVVILERLARVGKKLSTTGNGRCNISNRKLSIQNYHGTDCGFAEFALNKYNGEAAAGFFEKIGVPFVFEGDKAYPASYQASSVVDALRFAAEEAGVEILTQTRVTDIKPQKSVYKIICENTEVFSKTLLVCSGLYSGGEKLGCSGDVPAILKRLGLASVKATPAIVQLKTETDTVRKLKGIKIDALCTLCADGKFVRSDFGEVLFCDYGLSGPPILQISRNASRLEGKITVKLDIYPNKSREELEKTLQERKENLKERTLDEFFTGMLNKRLGQTLLKLCGVNLSQKTDSINKNTIQRLCEYLKCFEFKVTGNMGFINSQVTAGGISTDEFYCENMMSKKYKGLFASGEILDIDGDCGGFNLQWAWSSGMCAANGISKWLSGDKR